MTAAIGLDASVGQNQTDAMKAFEQLDADGVIDLQTEGVGKQKKYFLFAPNQWAEAKVIDKKSNDADQAAQTG